MKKEKPSGAIACDVALIAEDLSNAHYELETVRDNKEAARHLHEAKQRVDSLAKRVASNT